MEWTTSSGWRATRGCGASSRRRCTKPTEQWKQTGKPARVFTEFLHRRRRQRRAAGTAQRRVVAKAEHIDGKENPRYVVTSLAAERWPARALYEELYCARGDMENRIKEQFSLFADRVSAETMRANQLRLVSVGDGVHAGQRPTAAGAEGHGTGAGAGVDDPDEAVQDRRADTGERAARCGFRWHRATRGSGSSSRSGRTCAAEKPTAADNLQVVFSRKRPARTGAPKLPRNRQQSPHKPQEAPATAMHSPNRPSLFFGRSKKRDREPTSPHFYRLSYLVYRFNNIYPY